MESLSECLIEPSDSIDHEVSIIITIIPRAPEAHVPHFEEHRAGKLRREMRGMKLVR